MQKWRDITYSFDSFVAEGICKKLLFSFDLNVLEVSGILYPAQGRLLFLRDGVGWNLEPDKWMVAMDNRYEANGKSLGL